MYAHRVFAARARDPHRQGKPGRMRNEFPQRIRRNQQVAIEEKCFTRAGTASERHALGRVGGPELRIAHQDYIAMSVRTKIDDQFLAITDDHANRTHKRTKSIDESFQDRDALDLEHAFRQAVTKPRTQARRCDYSALNRPHRMAPSWIT